MDKAKFYAALRRGNSGVFGNSLSPGQVQGMEAFLAESAHWPLTWVANGLAEVYHETGGKMQPVTENLSYSSAARIKAVWPSRFPRESDAKPFVRNPEALANKVYGGRLGNDKPGDGWRYRGRGLPQITGKDNYRKFSSRVGVDLVAHPEKALELGVSVKIAVQGMEHGLFTGKALEDYPYPSGYAASRAIINGDVGANGPKIAAYASAFERALREAGYAPGRRVDVARLNDALRDMMAEARDKFAEKPADAREPVPAPQAPSAPANAPVVKPAPSGAGAKTLAALVMAAAAAVVAWWQGLFG